MRLPPQRVLVLHGPNLNLLGQREPHHYGAQTLTSITTELTRLAQTLGVTLTCHQSNHEGVLIDWVHEAWETGVKGLILNPGGYTHTSIALRDAFAAVAIPFIEVHLSNVHAREPFRQQSYLSDVAVGVITGLGADGYHFALEAAIRRLKRGTQLHQ